MRDRGIGIVEGDVTALEVVDDRLAGVRLRSGALVELQALAVPPRFAARADVLGALGLRAEDLVVEGHVLGSEVPAAAMGATAVPGVWVAGNVAQMRAQVVTAAAAGLETGAAINMDLVEEDVRRAVEDDGGGSVSGSDERAWEERYHSRPAMWSRNPNPQLMAEVANLAAGTALDAGCGEGADAIWLAARGWQVTAVDFSATALERGAARAQATGVANSVRWVHADLAAQAPDEQSYDLVSAQFLQLPPQPREKVFAALAAAVAPGGMLLIVGHHPRDLETTVHRPPSPEVFFTADELSADLDGQWEVEVAESRARPVTDSEGREVTVRDTVLRALRRPA